MSPDPPSGLAAALDRLRGAQKSSKGAPLYSLLVNRPLGRIFAAAAFQIGLTPNQVTAISAAFTFSAIVVLAFAPPTLVVGVVVAAGLVIGYALDSADGQLARLRGGGSLVGEWLDHVIDSAKIASLHLAVLISCYRHLELPSDWLLLVPVLFSIVATVHFFGMILNDLLARGKRAQLGLGPAPASSSPRWMSVAKLPTDYGLLCLIFLLLGFGMIFFWVYALLAVANLGYLILVLRKWYRDVTGLDRLVQDPIGVRR